MQGQSTGKSLSSIVGRMVPQFVTDDHQNFTLFLQKYFEYLEQDLKSYDLIANALLYADIDETVDDFIEQFRIQYTDEIPRKFSFLEFSADIKGDIRLVIKKIRDYYLTKGSELSYEFIFRVIYGINVDFYYPKVDILRCSDGKWYVPYYITPTTIPSNEIYIDSFIRGRTSSARAYVNEIIFIEYPIDSGFQRSTLSLTDVVGSFIDGEEIEVIGNESEFLTIESPDGVLLGQGRWIGTDGFLSYDKYIQDNDYYQEYSYELRTPISRDIYENLIKNIVHPAGLKLFGRVVIDILSIMDDFVSYTTHKIKWQTDSVINTFSTINTEIKHYLEDDHPAQVKRYSYDTVETQIMNDTGFYSNMDIEDLLYMTIDLFESNKTDNSSLVFVNGIKISGVTTNNEILSLSQSYNNDDELSIFSLGKQTKPRMLFDGNNSQDVFDLGATYNINSLLVFVNGIKLKTTEQVYISGTNLVFVTPPSTGISNIEVYVYDNLTTQQKFSGDGLTRVFDFPVEPYRYERECILVFVDGIRQNIVINNNKIVFESNVTSGTDNIEIVYFKRNSETYQTIKLDGVSTDYTIENVPNPFINGIGSIVKIIT